MDELTNIEKSAKSVMKRGVAEEIQKLISFLRTLLSTLGGKEDPAPVPQPEVKPSPRPDPVLAGLMNDRRRANSAFKFSDDRPLKDSW